MPEKILKKWMILLKLIWMRLGAYSKALAILLGHIFITLWHCHQTIEKALKMIIISKNKELLKIHDLPRLSNLAEVALSKKDKIFLEDLNQFYLKSRYPDLKYKPFPKPDKKLAQKYLTKTEKFFLWLQQQKSNFQKR